MEKTDTTSQIPTAESDDTTDSDTEAKRWYEVPKNWVKIFVGLTVLVFIIVAIIHRETSQRIAEGFLDWMENNAVLGSLCFIGLYWAFTVLLLPGSILTIGAGVVFTAVAGPAAGIFLATLVVFLGATLGASSAFLLGRFVFTDQVSSIKKKYKNFELINQVIGEQGLKVTFLIRLTPLLPFNVLNYLLSVTDVSFLHYNIAHFGLLPGTIAYCFIGSTVGSVASGAGGGFDNPVVLIVTIVGTVLALAGMVYVGRVALKQFKELKAEHDRKMAEEKGQDEEASPSYADDQPDTEGQHAADGQPDTNV